MLAWGAEGAGAAEVQRFEGIRGLHVMGPLLPRRQGPRSDDLEGVLLAQELLVAENLEKHGGDVVVSPLSERQEIRGLTNQAEWCRAPKRACTRNETVKNLREICVSAVMRSCAAQYAPDKYLKGGDIFVEMGLLTARNTP